MCHDAENRYIRNSWAFSADPYIHRRAGFMREAQSARGQLALGVASITHFLAGGVRAHRGKQGNKRPVWGAPAEFGFTSAHSNNLISRAEPRSPLNVSLKAAGPRSGKCLPFSNW